MINKEELIKQNINELKKTWEIQDNFLFDYKISILNDLSPYFKELKNIKHYILSNYIEKSILNNDIYSKIAQLENIERLIFLKCDLKETEKYITEGLKKISKLKSLTLVLTNLSAFPKVIFEIPTLEEIFISGNKFNYQTFSFKFKSSPSNEIIKIVQKKINNIFNKKFDLYKWGLYNKEDIILINNKYITINILEKKDKYLTFKNYYNLFKEIAKNETFLETKPYLNEKKLDCYLSYSLESFSFLKLTELLETGETKYKDYFITDLLIELGGEQLVIDIQNEIDNRSTNFSTEFYNENNFIENIKIENFKQFEKAELKNLDNLNIIVGKNGTGKTSLLQGITASLISNNSNDIENLENYINLKLKDKPNYLRFARTHTKWTKFEKAQRIFSKEIQSETIENNENNLPQSYLVLSYGENLYAKEHPFKKQKLDYQDVLAKGLHSSEHTEAIFKTSYEYMANPLDLLYELSEGQFKQEYQPIKDELLEIAEIIKNKLNRFLEKSTTQNLIIEKIGAYYKFFDKKKNQVLDFEQISEGYRSYIILLTDIILRILAARKHLLVNDFELKDIFEKVKGAIIIDEFDKHMHPSWQRIFLKTLTEEFPLIQFFLSTHNIVSLQSAEGYKIIILKEDGIIEEKIPVGYSIEAIYNEYFDEHLFSDKITKKLNKLKQWRNEMLRTKDYSKLENEEFLILTNELINTSSQLSNIVNIELHQLNKRRKNAQTK